MKKTKKNKLENIRQFNNVIKSSGVAISRKEIERDAIKSYKENESLLAEADREQKVLNMKRFYTKKGWMWPPKTAINITTVQLINNYYGKDVCSLKV